MGYGAKKKGKKGGGGKKCLVAALALALGGCSLVNPQGGTAVAGQSCICTPDPTGNDRCTAPLSKSAAMAYNAGQLIADWLPALPAILASLPGRPVNIPPSVAEVIAAAQAMAARVHTVPCGAAGGA